MVRAVHESCTFLGYQVTVIVVIMQVITHVGVMAVIVDTLLAENLFQFV